jgi:hypothetical protein
MRFFLLARARSTGLIRLLSERAYESRSAAVEAAGATASAGAIDLGDDEVLAVDLDAAGPVLVLRVQAQVAAAPPVPEPPVTPAARVIASAGLFAPAAPTPPPFAYEGPVSVEVDKEPAVRLQPRFPLFGADDDAPEEGLAETLRRVARRMEADLTLSEHTEWAAADDSWDARTLDDYALPDDAHLSGAREEGRLRIDAAERLRTDDAAVPRDADDPHDRFAVGAESVAGLFAEAVFRYDDEVSAETARGEAGEAVDRRDAQAGTWEDVRDGGTPEPASSLGDEMPAETAGTGLFGADDRTLDLLPEYPEEAFEPDALFEAMTDEVPPVDDVDVRETPFAGSETDDFRLEVEPEIDTTPFDDERERDAGAQEPGPEPEPYRPTILDFAMWVCADCVYQRTCRKAGVASPATCGNFQWRSF